MMCPATSLHVLGSLPMTVIYCSISSSADTAVLWHDLGTINTWCSTWLHSLNVPKYAHIMFTQPQHCSVRCYLWGASPLNKVISWKYPGAHLMTNLSWSNHNSTITSEANCSFRCLYRNMRVAPSSVKH